MGQRVRFAVAARPWSCTHLDPTRELVLDSQLRPGTPTAPGTDYLPLLPSGPDGVHSVPPRRTRLSTPLVENSPLVSGPTVGVQPR